MTTQVNKNSELKYAIELFEAMVKDNLGYIYRGSFNDDITDSILELTEVSLQNEEQSSKIKKRVYAIMVEGLQNITRHQDLSPNVKSEHKSIFVIQKLDDKYYITTGNIIEVQNIDNIKMLIKKINQLDKNELKAYYKQVLEEGSLSSKGGAGLGLIDMAKKSGNPLAYHFKKLHGNLYYFYLHTIPSLESNTEVSIEGKSNSLTRITKVHEILNQEDVLMIFNGVFNNESYSTIISSLKKNIGEKEAMRIKLDDLVSEMLQNIVKHGEKTNPELLGNQGIFYISQLKNHYLVTTGNYILNTKIEAFSQFVNKLNSSSNEEIDIIHKELLKEDNSKSDRQKLGFIGIRQKTQNTIHFSIKQTDNKYSFISLRIKLKS